MAVLLWPGWVGGQGGSGMSCGCNLFVCGVRLCFSLLLLPSRAARRDGNRYLPPAGCDQAASLLGAKCMGAPACTPSAALLRCPMPAPLLQVVPRMLVPAHPLASS